MNKTPKSPGRRLYKTAQKHVKTYDWTQLSQDIPPERRRQLIIRWSVVAFMFFTIILLGVIQ